MNRRGERLAIILVACAALGLVLTYLVMSLTPSARWKSIGKNNAPNSPIMSGVYLTFDTTKYTNHKGQIFIPSDAILDEMSFAEIEELYYRYIENIQITCPRSRHIGSDYDGGYHVCETMMPNNCLAYSFGSRGDYTFDDGLAAHYKCEVHTFDPADGQEDHEHKELVTFHKFGIGGKDEVTEGNLTLRTLESTRSTLGHTQRQLDLLKIDVEGAEWSALPQILSAKTLDKAYVKILIVELHMHPKFAGNTRETFVLGLHILRDLYNAGFRIYFFRIWSQYCLSTDPITHLERANCHEVHFLRK